jgi:shikimate kinase
MNLILIGYRGTGKSTVGRRVSAALSMPLVSLDVEIVRRAGQSIPELVKLKGWEHFRELETALILDYSSRSNLVIDCGGGVVEKERNFEPLRRSGTVFWLSATPATVISRIEDSRDRPALTEGQTFLSEIQDVLKRRTPLYSRLCHVRIATDQLSPTQVTDRILSLWPRQDQPELKTT